MRGRNRRTSAVLLGACATFAFVGCEDTDSPDATPTTPAPYILGVAVSEDDSAGAILVTVPPESAGSAVTDTSLTRFGIHIEVTDSSIARPALRQAVDWAISDSVLSGDQEADTRQVQVSFRSEWEADMVELQFPEGARILTVNGMDAQRPGTATAEIWRSRVGGVRDKVTVELPTRCDSVALVIAQHVLWPVERSVLKDTVVHRNLRGPRFRLMTSRQVILNSLPFCCS